MDVLLILKSLSALLTVADQATTVANRLSARLAEAHANPDDPTKQVSDAEIAEVRKQTDDMIAALQAKLAE